MARDNQVQFYEMREVKTSGLLFFVQGFTNPTCNVIQDQLQK
jgi:hypothetical protein